MLVDSNWLVGAIPPPLKNDGVKVSWDVEIPNIWKHKKSSKPPTSNGRFNGSTRKKRGYNITWIKQGCTVAIMAEWELHLLYV